MTFDQRFMIVAFKEVYIDPQNPDFGLKKKWKVHYAKPGYIEEELNNLQKDRYEIFSICPCETEQDKPKNPITGG